MMEEQSNITILEKIRDGLFAPVNNLFWFAATHAAALVCALLLPLLFFLAQWES